MCLPSTDNGSNIKTVKWRLGFIHLPCAGLSSSSALKVPAISTALSRCKKVITHFNQSRIDREELHLKQQQLGLPGHALIHCSLGGIPHDRSKESVSSNQQFKLSSIADEILYILKFHQVNGGFIGHADLQAVQGCYHYSSGILSNHLSLGASLHWDRSLSPSESDSTCTTVML